MRASAGETSTDLRVRAGRSPSTRSITRSAGVSSTVSLTGSAVSSPYRSAPPPGAVQRTDTR